MARQDNAEQIALEQFETRRSSLREDGRDGDLPLPPSKGHGIKLTGYRLYNLLCPLAFLIAKQVKGTVDNDAFGLGANWTIWNGVCYIIRADSNLLTDTDRAQVVFACMLQRGSPRKMAVFLQSRSHPSFLEICMPSCW
jgi:hypothetical protein